MKSSQLLNDLRDFNEIYRKCVTYDNIKSQKTRVSLSLWKIQERPQVLTPLWFLEIDTQLLSRFRVTSYVKISLTTSRHDLHKQSSGGAL